MPRNQRISGVQATPRSECDISVSRSDTLKIIAASNDLLMTFRQAQFYSSNGGGSWNEATLPLAPTDVGQFDPAVDWDLDGNAWAMTIGFTGPPVKMRIRCYKSVNGGANWTFDSTPSDTHEDCDREIMWVDHSPSSPFKNQIYVTWHSGAPAFVARRTTGPGAEWKTPIQVSGGETTGVAIGGDVKTNSAGHVFAFWPDNGNNLGASSHKIWVAKSINGGGAFGPPVEIGKIFADRRLISVPANSERKARVYVSGGAFRDSTRDLVYAVWTDLSGSAGCTSGLGPDTVVDASCKSRIWFSRSMDGGEKWSTPVKINDKDKKNDQFHARLAVDDTNGMLAVVYYDTIGDDKRVSTNLWMQTSSDDGMTWSAPSQVTTKRTNETSLAGGTANQYGDYIGLTGHAGLFHACWTDRRNLGEEEIWAAPLPVVSKASAHLFIKPPYTAWSLVHAYGPENPPPASGSVMHKDTTLATAGDGKVYAAVTGRLTIKLPGASLGYPFLPLPDPPMEPVPAVVVSVHLEPIQRNLSPSLRGAARQFKNLRGFTYKNVDLPSLVAALAKIAPPGSITLGKGPVRTPAQISAELLYGLRSIAVRGGDFLGQASTQGAPAGSRRLGFAVHSDTGPIDPSHVYDKLRDSVLDGQATVDAYLALAPSQWPVLSPIAPESVLLDLASQNLYSMAALDDLHPEENTSVSASLWRRIGNAQKAQWRTRLLARLFAGQTAPPFEFDDLDSQNIFQLEALVEFYANFREPWKPSETPIAPGPGYTTVDLLDPAGVNATASGNVVTLNPTADLDAAAITAMLNATKKYNKVGATNQVANQVYYDLLILQADTNLIRVPPRTYRITSINANARQLTLDFAPSLSGASPWTIRRRPVLVLVDCIGGRTKLRMGVAAAIDVNVPAGDKVTLDGLPSLKYVNENFDTIYLPADTDRPRRAYRIVQKFPLENPRAVRVDGTPVFTGGSGGTSRWHIQSGVSGDASDANPLAGTVAGHDNYDGRLFVVYRGRVQASPFPWTSYTSWENGDSASIRGNAVYAINGYRSGTSFRNFSFRVTDFDLPPLAGEHGDADTIAQARFYFRLPNAQDRPGGQINIRLHQGNANTGGSGSKGCLVSVQYGHMRGKLIELYKEEHPGDIRFDALAALVDIEPSKTYYTAGGLGAAGILASIWNSAIVGQLWLIRPDERHHVP